MVQKYNPVRPVSRRPRYSTSLHAIPGSSSPFVVSKSIASPPFVHQIYRPPAYLAPDPEITFDATMNVPSTVKVASDTDPASMYSASIVLSPQA